MIRILIPDCQWLLPAVSPVGPLSCEPQKGEEMVVKCKGDTCTDSEPVSATPYGVQPPSKEDKNVK